MSISEERIEAAGLAIAHNDCGPDKFAKCYETPGECVCRIDAQVALEADDHFAAAEHARGVRDGLTAERDFLVSTKAAINALLVMSQTAKPAKLDAAMSWRENDELARSMCKDSLAAIDARITELGKGEG